MKTNSFRLSFRLILAIALLFAAVHPLCAQVGTNWTGLNSFVTTNSATAKNKPVPAGGDGWQQPGTNGVMVKAGQKIWLAFLNVEAPLKKYFRIEFYVGSHAEAENLRFLDCGGFNGSGGAVGKTQGAGGPNSLNGEPRPGFVYQEFVFYPQPAWERISFINQNNHDIELMNIQAWSVCANIRPTLTNMLSSSNTLFGADGPGIMRTNQRIKQVLVFPKTAPVNPGVFPQFVAPPATGPWNFQFVQTDPYGGTHPLGIKWITGGPGLAPDQAVDFSFGMQAPQADWLYS